MFGPLGLFNMKPIDLKAIFLPFYLGMPWRLVMDVSKWRNIRKKSADYEE
jgi:hypothetical protein